ncbi:MAG: sugar transferase [Candidatus Delongbacteria bacterium]|nr:sugar transferase [Candidatus Delongbacteria bacterium]MBN2834441.1 sugar transferase [Candidatus Delongbacteria bacterium]
MYILVHKTGKPKEDTNPSYSPLIKMKRVGKNGKIIYVYKVRTMHPYSEYLHRFILDTFGYSKGGTGKPENDFRLTSWGKVLRKTWIDELPQLYNVLKGDLNLVGVRAVSQVRFEDIPKDLQELRIKFKPGCIPPSVVFKVIEQNQVDEAERKYLAEKQVRPYWTDFKYFWIAIYNILTGKIRSN